MQMYEVTALAPEGPEEVYQAVIFAEDEDDALNKYEVTQKGSKVALLGLGTFYSLANAVADEMKSELGIDATVINPYYITGLDEELLESLKADHSVVITIEDGIHGAVCPRHITGCLRSRPFPATSTQRCRKRGQPSA